MHGMYEAEDDLLGLLGQDAVSLQNMTLADVWTKPYTVGEGAWGLFLLITILLVNTAVLWVVSRSRELWKPRHLWMACLCITDLFVGGHKALELLLLVWPQRELCVLQRATMGIPYVVNMLLLTLLSLDRFVAVRHPFFYSATVTNRHVALGFLIVLFGGTSLAIASVVIGLQDPICRSQSLQMVYLTIVLAICSILTLFFNSAVLRIAKKQLNAIYAQDQSFRTPRRVSVVCQNCGYKNETYVNTFLPVSHSQVSSTVAKNPSILPLTDAVVLGHLDNFHTCDLGGDQVLDLDPQQLGEDVTTPLVKTVSMPTISDTLNLPVSLVVQPDPTMPPTVVIGNMTMPTEGDLGTKVTSLTNLDEFGTKDGYKDSAVSAQFPPIPRSRSLVTCQTHKIIPPTDAAPRLQLFRNLHFARAHMFHVGRLFPSIRFARTVLLIMIPMWVFILPIVIIIPLHRGCEEGNQFNLNCELVGKLWRYLIVHMRSVLPLQAILDTLIYAMGSKEFRNALIKLARRYRNSSK